MNTLAYPVHRLPTWAARAPECRVTASHRRPDVLVVDDDSQIRSIVRLMLQADRMWVLTVADGATGLARAVATRPAVIVLDLMLPKMSGYEVCARLRADHRTRDAAVLILSARERSLDVELGWVVGADDYLTKPFSRNELVKRVRRLLPGRGSD